jgi:transposase InsO family protein
VQDQRSHFIYDVLADQETFAALCRRYTISRKTGYKWLDRYREKGVAGLADRSRAPHQQARAVDAVTEQRILDARAAHPTWGEGKLEALLKREQPDAYCPTHSTIGALLKRRGLTHPRKRRNRATPSDKLTIGHRPNPVWAIDFKGWFRTTDGSRCDPLTVSDSASRFLLRCQVVERTDTAHVRPLMEALFRENGLPEVILSDNGAPFSSTGLAGLSRLNVWWTRLGIRAERIEPGHPEQNGRHERMHRTLREETIEAARQTLRGQQRAFDAFRLEYNEDRPHEALGMATPASISRPSLREYPERLPEITYPAGYELRRVQRSGDVHFLGWRFFLSETLIGEVVGLEEREDGWAIWFSDLEVAFLERWSRRRKQTGGWQPRVPRKCLRAAS